MADHTTLHEHVPFYWTLHMWCTCMYICRPTRQSWGGLWLAVVRYLIKSVLSEDICGSYHFNKDFFYYFWFEVELLCAVLFPFINVPSFRRHNWIGMRIKDSWPVIGSDFRSATLDNTVTLPVYINQHRNFAVILVTRIRSMSAYVT